MNLKEIVEQADTKQGRIFDLTIQFLIIVSLISFSIETLPNLSKTMQSVLWYIELFTVSVFTIEYLLRLSVADRKLKFVFSFYGIIDLLAILPFYISSGIDLRSIRALRLFRLFRSLKLFRYSKAIQRFTQAFLMMKEELAIFLMSTTFLLYFSAVGIYYFENPAQPEQFKSIFHSLWWATATLTTVGYGDVYPVTTGGRIFTFFILIIGLGIVAVPAGLIASALTAAFEKEQQNK